MKIVQIINSLGTGGAEKLLLDTLPLYRAAGIDMDIIVFWNNNHQFLKALKDLNCCKVIVFKNSDSLKTIYNPLNILKLKKYLKQYDIAHVHLFPAQYFAVFANVLNGNTCKLIFTEHSTFNRRMTKKWLLPLERFIYNKYSKIVCISQEIKDIWMRLLNLNEEKFVVIENGVNAAAIKNATAIRPQTIHSELNEDDQIILHVAAFRPGKDQETVIRAIALLEDPKLKLVFVGDGECRAACETLVKELDLAHRIFFLGQRMDVPQLLKSAKIVVLSSQYEGLSLASMEGMMSGRPFIASDVPGLKEVVQGAGVLFEYGNAPDLANKINALINDSDYYNQVVSTCLNRAAESDISKMVQKHIKLYYSVYES